MAVPHATASPGSVALGLALPFLALDEPPIGEPRGRAGLGQPAAGRPSAGRDATRSGRTKRPLIGPGLSPADDPLDHGRSALLRIDSRLSA
jgi:hypothetical protein